ncbi:holin [Bacillus cereus]|uniref:Holin n=2 Tax=Bacillus cereus TaxID=1396 RepID=A0A2A7FNU5_BACCE|nr:holin [Bacillus cereus]PGO29290.1 holin [Bacillus cereus]
MSHVLKTELFAQHVDGVSKYTNEFAIYFTALMTGVTWLLGGWDTALQVLMYCILIDLVTGVIIGFFVKKQFSSHRLRKGIGTKIGYLIVILLCNLFDMVFFKENPILRTASVWFYIYVEGSSILENLANLGVPVPQFLVDRMEQINEKVGLRAKMKDGKFVKSEDKDAQG